MCVYACYTVYFSRSNKLRSTTNDTKCTVLAANVTRCSLITHDKAGRKTIMTVIYMEQLQFRRIFSRYLKKSGYTPFKSVQRVYNRHLVVLWSKPEHGGAKPPPILPK